MSAESPRSLKLRLDEAFRALTISFSLSLAGTVVDAVVLLLSGGLILMTDLLHWVVDTILEGILLLMLHLTRRLSVRFPWTLVALEAVAVTSGAAIVLAVYGYFFLDYIGSLSRPGARPYTGYLPLLATVSGAVITAAMFIVTRREYRRLRIELLRFDSAHALADLVASVAATAGILATTLSGSYAVELAFTFVLMTFVVHSLVEVLKDNVRTISGYNRVPHVESHLMVRLSGLNSPRARVAGVVARKFGSLVFVEVSVDADPRLSVLELHRLRSKVVRAVRESSELVYHVDVVFYPGRRGRRISRTARSRRR